MANSLTSISPASKLGRPSTGALEIDGRSIEGVSVGGQETCILLPAYKVAFDIGRCPQRAVSHDFLFISHAHMDHIVRISVSPFSSSIFYSKGSGFQGLGFGIFFLQEFYGSGFRNGM